MEKEIVDYLIKKYQPRFMILHGSRVDGEHRPNSDWDIALSNVASAESPTTESYLGQSLDVGLIGSDTTPIDFIRSHGPIFQRARVLHDDLDRSGATFVDEIQKFLAEGRNLNQTEINNRFLRMSRVLDKMLGSLDTPELFFIHLATLYELALRFWFEFKNQWSQPHYVAIKKIRQQDPSYNALLEKIYKKESDAEALRAAFKIYKITFPDRYTSHASIGQLSKV